MKTVSISVDEGTWAIVERLAQTEHSPPDLLVARALTGLTGQSRSAPPPPEKRRETLDLLWAAIDACNVEVGERPSRARTYDQRRFHRY